MNPPDSDFTPDQAGWGIVAQLLLVSLGACLVCFWRAYNQDNAALGNVGDNSGLLLIPPIFLVTGTLVAALATLAYPAPAAPASTKRAHALAVLLIAFCGSVGLPLLWGFTLLIDPIQADLRGAFALPMLLKNTLLGGAFAGVMWLLLTRLRQQRSLYVYADLGARQGVLVALLLLLGLATFFPWYG